MSRAFIFPGQGAQTIGMGRDLAETYAAARAVFEEVDEALGQNLSHLIWEGDQDELTLTANAQPALMATSMAAVRALEAEGFALKDYASFVAGHSLGDIPRFVRQVACRWRIRPSCCAFVAMQCKKLRQKGRARWPQSWA